MKLKPVKIIVIATTVTATIATVGSIVGLTILLATGSAKAISKLGEVIKRHEPEIDAALVLGVRVTIHSFCLWGSVMLIQHRILWKLFDKELDATLDQLFDQQLFDQTIEDALTPQKDLIPRNCSGCKFYDDNGYLNCAVNPSLPPDCADYEN